MADTTLGNKISVISVLLECIFYGILSVLLAVTLFAVSRKRITAQLIRIHVVGGVMFILATIHIAVNIHRITDTFANSDDGVFLAPLDDTVFLLKQATLALQIVLSDGFWLYRLHVVWNGDKRLTIPFAVILIATVSLGIYTIILFGPRSTRATSSFPPEIRNIGGTTLILGLVMNLGCTILIASRLYYTNYRVRLMRTAARNGVSTFMFLVIQSGAIQSAFLLAFVISLTLDSRVSIIPAETAIVVAGIFFYVMMIQSTLGYCSTNGYSDTALSGHPTLHRHISLRRTSTSRQDVNLPPPPDVLNLRPVVVHVTKWESRAKEPHTSPSPV